MVNSMNLFLVTSPFQCICANEARDTYKTKNNILILVRQQNEAGRKHQEQVLERSAWDHIIEVDRKNRTFVIPKILRQLKSLTHGEKLDHFFFSEYTSWRTRMFLANVVAEKLILIDDGMLNLYEYYKYIKPKADFSRKRFLQDLLITLQGCKNIGIQPFSKKLEMFSIFDIDKPVCPLRLNNLDNLRNRINSSQCYDPNGPIGFIGEGAIGDKNQPSIQSYVERIKSQLADNDRTMIYFPHRTEVQELSNLIKKIPNIIYHKGDLPLELEIAHSSLKLSSIVGVTSTALYTLSLLYKEIPIKAHKYNIDIGEGMTAFLHNHFSKNVNQSQDNK